MTECGKRTVFWPDVEACDAECCLEEGHQPPDVHRDHILGEWSEEDMETYPRMESE